LKKNLKKYHVLALSVCAVALMGTSSAKAEEGFTPAQKEEINALVKDYIMNNPNVILDAVDKYQRGQQERVREEAETKLKEYLGYYQSEDLPVVGNPKGSVTVVEYFDYNCGYCKKAFDDLVKLLDEDKDLRVVFQDLPVLGPGSVVMARASLASQNQGKYFELHRALMEYKGPRSEEAVLDVAKKIGLDVEKLKTDMQDPLVDLAIEKQRQMAASIGITGTPGFVIGEKMFPGYIGMEGLKTEIANAREAAAKKPQE